MTRKPKVPLLILIVLWGVGLALVVLLALLAMRREDEASNPANDPEVKAHLREMDMAQDAYLTRKEAERRKMNDLP